MKKVGFDNERYIKLQESEIKKRINGFDKKLYLEIGGKLFDDLHASRVLPGFESNCKIQFLRRMRRKIEIICCVSAKHIEAHKMRSDVGLSYDKEVQRLLDSFRKLGLLVSSIVVTLFEGEKSAIEFVKEMESHGEKVYIHRLIDNYPIVIDHVVSDAGYGSNSYIKTSRPLVVVTAPGACSGKLATCLSQLYHEYKRGVNAGYAKFETFPVWNLSINHPVNVAYEAATANIRDKNMIDPFHYDAYKKTAINYNRDIESFPILREMLFRISGREIYKSPTDMGVNMSGYCITDDKIVCAASKQEVVRRYLRALADQKMGKGDSETVDIIKRLMTKLKINEDIRRSMKFAREYSLQSKERCLAIELDKGNVVFGTRNKNFTEAAQALFGALKAILKDDSHLSEAFGLHLNYELERRKIKEKNKDLRLSLNDVVDYFEKYRIRYTKILRALRFLDHCDAHSTFLVDDSEKNSLRKLGIYLTEDFK